jgi:4-hydroxy-tetrahydrodipicolinate reductase
VLPSCAPRPPPRSRQKCPEEGTIFMSATKPIRVFQVATGNVGTEMIKRIAHEPDLELIGLHCYTPEKVGRDAGEIAGLAPNGVTATGSIDDIIAAKPDVLTFHGVFPDEDLYIRVLEAGINIVTTADWITGWHRDTNHPHPSGKPVSQLLRAACEKGGSTFYGTGMNPGVNQILGVVCSADVAEIENVTTIESVDVSCHHSKDTWIEVGYGMPVDDPSIPGKLEKYTRVFADSVLMMADCFDLQLDEVKLVHAAQGIPGRQLHQVPGHGRRCAPSRDSPRVADDAAYGSGLGYQGLLHHSDQGRPVHLQQAHDLP